MGHYWVQFGNFESFFGVFFKQMLANNEQARNIFFFNTIAMVNRCVFDGFVISVNMFATLICECILYTVCKFRNIKYFMVSKHFLQSAKWFFRHFRVLFGWLTENNLWRPSLRRVFNKFEEIVMENQAIFWCRTILENTLKPLEVLLDFANLFHWSIKSYRWTIVELMSSNMSHHCIDLLVSFEPIGTTSVKSKIYFKWLIIKEWI